jgi:hypothetical protein
MPSALFAFIRARFLKRRYLRSLFQGLAGSLQSSVTRGLNLAHRRRRREGLLPALGDFPLQPAPVSRGWQAPRSACRY